MKRSIFGSVIVLLAGCTVVPDGTIYRGGQVFVPTALGLNQHVEFRFLEKWKVQFSWLYGPAEISGCGFSENPFRKVAGWEELAVEANAPQWEWNGTLVSPQLGFARLYPNQLLFALSGTLEKPVDIRTQGLNTDRIFKGFAHFCDGYVASARVAAVLRIVKADPSKGTEGWVHNPRMVEIGSNRWLLTENPISDYAGKRYGDLPLLEAWVLKIPDTDYWMVLTFNASKQFSYVEHRIEFEKTHSLFRQAVESVRLAPIKPVVRQEDVIRKEDCKLPHPKGNWHCFFNYDSRLSR